VLKTFTLNGTLTFTNDLSVSLRGNVVVNGDISATGKTITVRQGGFGSLVVASTVNDSATTGTVMPAFYAIDLSGSSTLASNDPCYPLYRADSGTNTTLKNSTIENFTVESFGRLGGIGTITGALTVKPSGILAPGFSPGCINSGNLTINGTYEVELQDVVACTKYDQTKVTGTVDLTGGTLNIIRYGGMVPRLNNTFMIIDNDGSDAVTGTFTGLAQGATTKVDGITYTISYTGGSGNDVVLTVTAVDSSLGAPNTGFLQLLKSGILLPLFAAASGASILTYQAVSRRKR
jgi:hypothetical protein